MSEEKEEKGEVAVVPVAEVVPTEPTPARDRSEDGITTKFVVCIVELPFVIIGITLAISLILAIFTMYQVVGVYGTDWFAQGRKGSEDQSHITSLSYDAIEYAMDKSWPEDPTVKTCGGGRRGFRRLETEDADLIQAAAPRGGGLQALLAPVIAERFESELAAEGVTVQGGLRDQIKDLPLDLRTQPLPRVPVDWTLEKGIIWEDELPADDSRRRLQRGNDECEEEPEPEPEDADNVVWDYSGCDVHAVRKPKNATTGEGATGPGCNALCDPEEEDDCEPTLMGAKDFFVLVFEAVSGDNTYYAPLDDDDIDDIYPYNPFGDGPGDSLSPVNLAEAKRLQDVILKSEKYLSDFCLITVDPRSSPPNRGKCGGMTGLVNFFYPRARQTGDEMFDELQRAFPPGMSMEAVMNNAQAALATDFGCHLNYFFFEMYQGPAGFAPMMQILGTVLAVVTAEPGGPTAILRDVFKPVLVGLVDGTRHEDTHLGGFAAVFEWAICAGVPTFGANGITMPTRTPDQCNDIVGCTWSTSSGGSCVEDLTHTEDAEAFADVMCLGDGTGEQQAPDKIAAKADLLAYFHDQDHLRPFLDFFFDKGFSPGNPTTKYSRAFMQFGTPMPGYRNKDEGEDKKTGAKGQEDALVKWFMEDVDNPSKQSIRQEYADKSEADKPDDETKGQVEVTYLLSVLLFDEISALIIGDMLLAVLSFAVVGFYMWFQTGSLWIAAFGMLEITMSLPIGLWVYTYLFGIEYFDFICSLALYIVMAIGADDVFIWFDAYKQSAYEDAEVSGSLETRFIWAWHKAASAMLVTSLTTCVAFFATATSPMLSIKSFGYFTAFVIWLDYMYVITWLPAATVLYNWWFENTGFCRCTCCGGGPCAPVDKEKDEPLAVPCCLTDGDKPKAICCGAMFGFPFALIFSGYFWWLGGQGAIYAKAYGIGFMLFFIMLVGLTSRIAATIIQGKDGRKTVEFFEGPFSDFITDEKTRKALLIGAAAIIIPFFIGAFYLTPTTKDEQILPDDHPLQKIIFIMNGEFPVSGRDEKVMDQIMFGIKGDEPFDRKGANPLLDYMRDKEAEAEAARNGEQPHANYDPTFDWTHSYTQRFIAEQCMRLDASEFLVQVQDQGCTDDPCPQFRSACIVADLATWLTTNCTALALVDPNSARDCKSAAQVVPESHPGYSDNGNVTYLEYYGIEEGSLTPTRCAGEHSVCQAVTSPPDANSCPDGCEYENAFLKDTVFENEPAKANRAIYDFYQLSFKDRFSKAVGFGVNDAADCVEEVNVNTEEVVTYCAPNPEKGVKYVALEYAIELKRRAYYPESEFRAVYDKIEAFTQEAKDSNHPYPPAHRTTSGKWKFMRTQHIYVKYALYGIACAVLLAFVVLCIATNNIIAASLAVLTIALVCICVLGSMVFGGWELGNMESICLTILAGFCVDYIVHLAHSYMESPDRSTRIARVRYSVGHMGVSVLSGALTSLGAALLLFFCTLQFFATFGTFFFGTIFLAWLWANFFFIPALGTLGPQGIQGDFYGNMFGPKAEDSAGGKETTSNPAAAKKPADSDATELAED